MATLSQQESLALMKKIGISTPKAALAKDEDRAAALAEKIGWPVALKIASPDIVHKTEAGGIALDIKEEPELRASFRRILASVRKFKPSARIDGILVEEMCPGHELIVGASRDAQFGPVVMLGTGGIYVEIFKDVTFRIAPIEKKDASEMIKEIKGYAILKGVRGEKPISFSALEKVLLAVSSLVYKDEKIQQLDINPLFAGQKAVAGDVRVVVSA